MIDTMLKVRMRNDLTIDHPLAGGAEQSCSEFISQRPDWVQFVDKGKSDLLILNNFRSMKEKELEELPRPYVVYWRDALDLPFSLGTIQRLISSAVLNIALSPLHKKELQNNYGNDGHWLVVPPYMDLTGYQFERDKVKDNGNIMWAGRIYAHKGIENALLWARERSEIIDFYGAGDPLILGQLQHSSYANYMGERTREELKEVYKTYKRFLHLPERVEAFGRCVAEAFFSGCTCILGDLVGFTSYDWNYEDVDEMRTVIEYSPLTIWKEIERVL